MATAIRIRGRDPFLDIRDPIVGRNRPESTSSGRAALFFIKASKLQAYNDLATMNGPDPLLAKQLEQFAPAAARDRHRLAIGEHDLAVPVAEWLRFLHRIETDDRVARHLEKLVRVEP